MRWSGRNAGRQRIRLTVRVSSSPSDVNLRYRQVPGLAIRNFRCLSHRIGRSIRKPRNFFAATICTTSIDSERFDCLSARHGASVEGKSRIPGTTTGSGQSSKCESRSTEPCTQFLLEAWYRSDRSWNGNLFRTCGPETFLLPVKQGRASAGSTRSSEWYKHCHPVASTVGRLKVLLLQSAFVGFTPWRFVRRNADCDLGGTKCIEMASCLAASKLVTAQRDGNLRVGYDFNAGVLRVTRSFHPCHGLTMDRVTGTARVFAGVRCRCRRNDLGIHGNSRNPAGFTIEKGDPKDEDNLVRPSALFD